MQNESPERETRFGAFYFLLSLRRILLGRCDVARQCGSGCLTRNRGCAHPRRGGSQTELTQRQRVQFSRGI